MSRRLAGEKLSGSTALLGPSSHSPCMLTALCLPARLPPARPPVRPPNRLQVLLRGVLTGTHLLAASHADDQWAVLAGDAIDAAAAGEGRAAALDFLAAAAAAMNGLLQHLRG